MKNKEWYKNKNIWIIAALVLIIAAVLVFALVQGKAPSISSDAQQVNLTEGAETEEFSAAAYVLCSLPSSGQYGLLPLPQEGSVSYPIRQVFADGTETENILHLTPEGFSMESSTCANQDCVHQGEVTLENREERVLQNSVICLPNQVMAELYTAEEIEAMDLPSPEAAADDASAEE